MQKVIVLYKCDLPSCEEKASTDSTDHLPPGWRDDITEMTSHGSDSPHTSQKKVHFCSMDCYEKFLEHVEATILDPKMEF